MEKKPMTELSPEQWEWLEEKYGKLLHHIAYKIGGDAIINGHEDSYQDLCIAMLDTVNAFDGKTPDSFDEYKSSRGFDKYIKTCLWNRKNSNGIAIQKKAHIRNTISLSTNEDIFFADDENCGDSRQQARTYIESKISEATSGVDEMFKSFGDVNMDTDTRSIVTLVESDGKMIKPNGMLNINRIAKSLGKKKHQVKYIVERLQTQLKDYNGN